jgi:hypothetical protein
MFLMILFSCDLVQLAQGPGLAIVSMRARDEI